MHDYQYNCLSNLCRYKYIRKENPVALYVHVLSSVLNIVHYQLKRKTLLNIMNMIKKNLTIVPVFTNMKIILFKNKRILLERDYHVTFVYKKHVNNVYTTFA